jgi:hypothetical protein
VVVWIFARRWSRKTVNVILLSGVGLLLLSVVGLVVAGQSSANAQSVPMFFAQNLAVLAMPCVSVLSVVADKNREGKAGA